MNRKIICGVLAMALIPVITLPQSAKAEESVYPISNAADFAAAMDYPELNYELTDNIDIGSNLLGTADEPFNGKFNGNGYTVTCTRSVFGTIGENGIVENLIVRSQGNIKSSYNSEEYEYAASIAQINYGTIRQSCTSGSLCDASAAQGGIAAVNSGVIEDCVSETKAEYAVAGVNNGSIRNCYTTLELPITDSAVNVSGCYSAMQNPIGGAHISEADMKNSQLYSGWDFAGIWTTCGGRINPIPISVIGKGTEDEPYRIRDVETLAALCTGGYSSGKYFKQAEKISDSGSRAGTDEDPFLGVFDGDNRLTQSVLFQVVGESGIVRNVNSSVRTASVETWGGIANRNYGTIQNSYVDFRLSRSEQSLRNTGGIAGENYGIIEDCRTNNSSLDRVGDSGIGLGGIAGYNYNGTIRRCRFGGGIYDSSRASGGIVGDSTGGIIEDCYAVGTIATKGGEVGGIAGRLYNGTIKNCYASCYIGGSEYCGGLVGRIIEDGRLINSFFKDSASDSAASGSGTDAVIANVLTAAQAKQMQSFPGWDFVNTWFMDGGMPELISVNGNGTEEHPYLIRNMADWNEKAERSLQSTGSRLSYVILNDIPKSSNSQSVGTEEDPFIGRIDGGGHECNFTIKTLGRDGYITNCVGLTVTTNHGIVDNCCNTSVRVNDGGVIRYFKNYFLSKGFPNTNGGKIQYCYFSAYQGEDYTGVENSLEKDSESGDPELFGQILNGSDGDPLPVERNYLNERYTDISGHWAEQIIWKLIEQAVIDGYDDHTFRPDNGIAKGEFLKLLLNAANAGTSDTPTPFTDANESWAAAYVSRAYVLGMTANINTGSTRFGVDNMITRLEAAVLIGRLLKPSGSETGAALFSDIGQIPDWARKPVGAAAELGIIDGMENHSLMPSAELTRAQAAVIADRVQQYIMKADSEGGDK